MKNKLRISKAAQNDLLSIGRYTQEKWGVSQRNIYLKQIDESFKMVLKHPAIGQPYKEVKQGYLKYSIFHFQ